MSDINVDLVKRMYEQAFTIRRFEQRAIEQYRLGNIRGYFHPYLGEEGVAVGAISALNPDDYITSHHRGHGHCIVKGHEVKYMFAEVFGKATGYCRGLGGSMHISSRAYHNLGANGIVGAGLPIAVGAAMGIKQKGTNQVVECFFGDGGSNNGTFHESVNLAAIFHLPVIFILENNHYAVSTPIEDSALIYDLSARAAGYGIPGVTVEGNDAIAVYEVVKAAIERARNGQGPTLIECKTYRHGGHHVNDPGAYMPKEKLDYWKSKDPVDVLRKHMVQMGVAEAEIDAINAKVEKDVEDGVQFALESPEMPMDEFMATFVEPD